MLVKKLERRKFGPTAQAFYRSAFHQSQIYRGT